MAKYDREFLVPYLHDLCALYLADKKLEREIAQKERMIFAFQTKERVIKPQKPNMRDDSIGCIGFLAFIFAAMGVILLFGIFLDPSGMGKMPLPVGFCLAVFAILSGGFVFWTCYSAARDARLDNEASEEIYKKEMKRYYESCKCVEETFERNKLLIPQIRTVISKLEKERVSTQAVIHQVYQANVIPGHYRNMYVAVYLYDYFSTSRANDLDMALNTFVLEQIKDKLDIIIERQQEMILNQRMIIANQRQEIEEQRKHNAYMRRRACEIAANTEEQNQYLAMIESNTAASAYFAAANYLK